MARKALGVNLAGAAGGADLGGNKLHYKTGFCNIVSKAVGKVQNTNMIKTSQHWNSVYVLCDSEIYSDDSDSDSDDSDAASQQVKSLEQPLAADNLMQDYPIFVKDYRLTGIKSI